MNATTVWSLSDPVRIQLTGASNVDLFHSVFPDSNPNRSVVKMLEAAPVQRGFSMATVWIADFPARPDCLMSFFANATIEHQGSSCKLRNPTVQEYLEFQGSGFISGLVGAISVHEDHFFYDDDEHEPFDVICTAFEVGQPSRIFSNVDYRDYCVKFLLIVEGL